MSSTQHQLIEQCATRLRGIVEALDNIHDTSPHRWSTDLDDVHSSAESLLAMIKDQAPTQAAQGLAGAALAQPSPAQAEQAEAERPEMSPERAAYFMRRFKSEEKLLGPNEQAAVDYVLSLLAQHDRIVGELRDELEAERKRVNIYVNNNRIRQDNERLRAELRDALARVAGLELGIARIAGDFLPDNSGQAELALDEMRQALHELLAAAPTQAQHSVPDGAADLCRFLAKLYCELDGLRYSTAKLPAEQIADALIFKWPVLQGARNQLNIKRISEQPYDESKLHSAIAAMLAAAPGKEVPQAWIDVQEERRRQITAEGWTPEHDDEHADGQMAQAAGCYALHAGGIGTDWPDGRQNGAALFWPWDKDSWKPTTPRRDLVKACALALAEIERLDRAAATQGGPSDA
ncbi:hypothetical protein [Pseudomonas aeruginosa]|uniref:hypothetical protein n=1 Tax=Pseudomonas aeruginosa TaxID=287 RepID=UPI001872C99D|nr:hypothetical protein [Pseudomonas aeruginosa]